ncbi:NusG domain II-containing protein [Clostridium tetani]|uniref:NusG domain II-containing protein n=1 Tax=Clostridium tetani TaxID=1513 RepID=UPI0003C0D791|nr:NusG domain II-containing protein [Clostridium tetani]CDI49097.1 membrane associated protein [Clostridium tetani 12124569]
MKKGDKIVSIIIASVIILSFIGIYVYKNSIKSDSKIAVIKQDGKIIKKINLYTIDKPETFLIKSNNGNDDNNVKVEKGKVSILEATCPDQVCVKAGPISEPGDTLVCLPNKLIIVIEGKTSHDKDKLDAVTY